MAHYNYTWLSQQDVDFLHWETPNLPMHGSGIQIFDLGDLGNDDGGVDFERLKRAMESVLHRIPRYRQKIKWTPSGNQAVWVDDANFNLDYHLRHISLPRPGTERQLKTLASRIMEYPLDRSRPLWENWILEGLEGGRFVMVLKTHHCMIDGSSGVDLAQLMMSTERTSDIPEAPRFVPRPVPADSVLAREARLRGWSSPVRLAGRLRRFAAEADGLAQELNVRARAVAEMAAYKITRASQTPLNGEVGPHRSFDYATTSLADLKALRRHLDVSVNDLVLTIVTGAVRRFLMRRSVSTEHLDFRVSTPVNVRTERDRDRMGNRVSSWIVPLPLDESDPLAQLERIRRKTLELKRDNTAVAVEMMNTIHEWIPLDIQALSSGTQNMIVTNVPGPPMPLYMLGAELLAVYPQAPLIQNLGLVVGVFSYNGTVHWGFNADQDRVPDLADFRKDVLRSFERLLECAGIGPLPPEAEASVQPG